jgi:fructokinase
MNGDAASLRIRADMKKWGVQLKFASCKPTTDTPIIVQKISRSRGGAPRHRFSWACPHCGSWLPGFKPVPTKSVEGLGASLVGASAFFMDRLSRSALVLAKQAADHGAVVVFEPSAKSDEGLLGEALQIAHIIKYSDERFARIAGAMEKGSGTLVEVQTFGANGLRYRRRLDRGASAWKQLDAIAATHLADTCGSGDWCTAGLISNIAKEGLEGLEGAGEDRLVEAVRFGQKLAAWNVGFEGARGGMYAIGRQNLERHLLSIASGENEFAQPASSRRASSRTTIACPACPPVPKPTRARKIHLGSSV